MNLAPGNDFPHMNALWNSAFGQWYNWAGPLTDLNLDANGWPLSTTKGGSGNTYTDGVAFPIQVRPFDTNLTVFCVGIGTIVLQGSGSSTVTCPSITGTAITRSGIFQGTLSGVDQPANGSHVTALAVVPTTQAAQFLAAGCLTSPAQVSCINPDFKSINAQYRVLRMMDYQSTNTNTQTTTWASRPTAAQPFPNFASTQAFYNGAVIPWGFPVEMEVAMCNSINASCYFNLPVNVTNDYAQNLGATVSATLSQSAYYEYVNEVWNCNGVVGAINCPILAARGAAAFGTSASFVAGMSYYQMQAANLFGLIAANSSNNRYYRVLGLGPNQNTQGSSCGNCANWWLLGGPVQGNLWTGWSLANFDVTAIAPYISTGLPAAWGAPSLLGNVFTQLQSGGLFPITTGANTTTNSGNNYVLTSSSACGNGAIPATPANGTFTCFKANASASTGAGTLKVDGGTTRPLIFVISASNNVQSTQLDSSKVTSGSTYTAVYTTTTGSASYAAGTTYATGFPVVASDGNTYYSLANGNVGNNPVTDGGVHWQALTPAWWICDGCDANGGASSISSSAVNIVNQTVATRTSLSTTLPLMCYESGAQILSVGDTFLWYTMDAAQADSRFAAVYLQLYGAVKTAGINGICNHFNDVQSSIFGSFGFLPTMYTSSGISPQSGKQQGLIQYIQQNPKAGLP